MRELIFQGTLSLIIGASFAAVVVVTMRLVQTLIEIVMALVGWIILKRTARALSDKTN